MKCRKCGKGAMKISKKGRFLKRINPKGEFGIWECLPSCKYEGEGQEEALLNALEGEQKIIDGDVKNIKIVYKNNKPHGIRDEGGFLLFFPERFKFPGQDERYREEVKQQLRLADFLLNALKNEKACPLYVDYKKSCQALKDHELMKKEIDPRK